MRQLTIEINFCRNQANLTPMLHF